MVASYLRDFVKADFVAELNLETLELVSGSYVSDTLHTRENDVVWKVKSKGADAYLFIMIEAQRKQDPWMAVRMLNYTTSLWLNLVKRKKVTKKTGLPAVIPLVIYNGKRAWAGPLELASLLGRGGEYMLEILSGYRYFVLDEGRIPKEEIASKPGFASLFVRLEQAISPDEVKLVVEECASRLKAPEYINLNHAIAAWTKYMVLLEHGFAAEEQLKAIDDLQGVNTFMERNMQTWKATLRAEGRAEGEVGALRESLYSFLQSSLGNVPSKLCDLLAMPASPDMLRTLRDQAYMADDLRAFLPRMEKALLDACGQKA